MSRRWTWITAAFAILIAFFVAVSVLVDGPLRGILEQRLNATLQGYPARLGTVNFHPLSLALDGKDLVISQDANPAPPVMPFPR
jgi:hypothetical protein